MSVTIIILQYGKANLTVEAVRSLIANGLAPCVSRVLVVDNNSPSVEDRNALRDLVNLDPRIELKFCPINYGFAGAHNIIIREIDTDYLLLLNNDTLILDGGVSDMIDHFFKHKVDIGTGVLLNEDMTIQASTLGFYGWPAPVERVYQKMSTVFKSDVDSAGCKPIVYCNGALLWIRRTIFDDVGGFDQSLFMYGEDLDLMIKLNKAGYKIKQFTKCKIIHYGGQSSAQLWSNDDKFKLQMKQGNRVLRKHYPSLAIKVMDLAACGLAFSKSLLFLVRGKRLEAKRSMIRAFQKATS